MATGPVGLESICANCYVYNWVQPEGKITLRCSRCKRFYYCSKECQEEHWRKTHKHHCKFLSGPKMEEAKREFQHVKTTCKYCILQASSLRDVFEDNNPNYVCIDDPANVPPQKSMLHFMSFVTHDPDARMERMTKTMQRLLEKMKQTNHPTFQRHPSEMEEIAKGLLNLRERIYNERLFDMKGYHMKVQYMRGASNDEVNEVSHKIGHRSDHFKTWETYMTLTMLLVFVDTVRLCKTVKSPEISLPSKWRDPTRNHVDSFLTIVDQLLEALEEQVVAHSQLAAIACQGGNPEQKCSICQKEITVTGILYPEIPLWCVGIPVVLLSPIEDVSYSCGSDECTKEAVGKKKTSFGAWSATVGATVVKLTATKCDFCFLLAPLKEVHRSLCKTKKYCSSICRNADDSVHKVCCKQGIVEERKVKSGGKEKPELANRNLDLFVTSFENAGLGEPNMVSKLKKMKLKDSSKKLKMLENTASEVD